MSGDGLRLEETDRLEDLRDEWDELALRSRNIFSTWEWLSLWRRHFAADRTLRVVSVRGRDNELVAVLPLFTAGRRPVRVLRFLGRGHADELGPICAPDDRPAAAHALRGVIESGSCDLFLGDDLPGDFEWSEALGARVVDRTASPLTRFDGQSWDEFIRGRSVSLRRQLGRLERRLGEHGLRYRLTTDPSRLEDDLDTLFALHTARWHGSQWFVSAESFHREFAATAFEQGWVRLWIMELEGMPAAAWLGYRFAGIESYYQAGRDTSWHKHSIGVVLLAHTIRSAVEDGIEEYRFLRGPEDYKFRFATENPGVVSVALATSMLGRVGLAARSARRKLRVLLSRS
jgi:CelD/BcsL family acetyltransferase involved in cellulose biosynthesis